MSCSCSQARLSDGQPLVEAFDQVRTGCPALNLLLAPDEVWQTVVADASGPLDKAHHCSCLLLAYDRGFLERITSPVHRFLLDGGTLRANLTRQYRRDLQERWLSESDELSRHGKFKMFFGKLVELQIADWLAGKGWPVIGLEALGHDCDIGAQSPEGVPHSIEVKYVGQGIDNFRLVVDALGGGPGTGSLPLYGAINYVLFRTYEAAVGLRRHANPKLAVIVIDAQTWPTLDVPLGNRWLDWDRPAFLQTEEQDWNRFLNEQRVTRYPNIGSELADLVHTLDSVWIVRLDTSYRYSLKYEQRLAG